VVYSYSNTPDGYIIEAKMPWETINGRILKTDTSTQLIPIKQLPKVYMLEVTVEEQSTRLKFIKE
jgi:hypothetical protein